MCKFGPDRPTPVLANIHSLIVGAGPAGYVQLEPLSDKLILIFPA